jgi:hypothetical protein
MSELDFLDVHNRSFSSERDFFEFVEEDGTISEIGENVNVVGSVNNYSSRSEFHEVLSDGFEEIWSEEDVSLLAAHYGGRAIPYYALYNEDFPIFITTANITKEMPNTITEFLQNDPHLGRFWLSMEQLEQVRRTLVRKYDDLIIPFFTGHRSKYSDVPAEKRENIERTISYWAEDGRETFKEVRTKYGVLPTNIRFERPNDFKFGVKQEGIFTHQMGSIIDIWELLDEERKRKRVLKTTINSGGFDSSPSSVFDGHEISHSRPWAVEMSAGLTEGPIEKFEDRVSEDKWEFGVSEFRPAGGSRFRAELIDDNKYGRTRLDAHNDVVRVYPLDGNDIDPQFRIFAFMQDHFDSSCSPAEV